MTQIAQKIVIANNSLSTVIKTRSKIVEIKNAKTKTFSEILDRINMRKFEKKIKYLATKV